jgi:hypothetical protein
VITCFCCANGLVRASDIPEAHWLRQGDLYCRTCELVIWREELFDGWPVERVLCHKHLTRATKGDR